MLTAEMLGLNRGLAPGLSTKNAVLYLIFVSVAIEAALLRNRSLELLSVIVPFLLFVAYALLSWSLVVLFEMYPGYNAFRSFIVFKGAVADHILVFLVFFYGVTSQREIMWLFKAMIWTTLAVSLVGLLEEFRIISLGLVDIRNDGRAGGPIGEPNQYAAFLAMFMPAALGLAMIESGRLRKLAYLGFAVAFIAFLTTISRGGIAGILGSALLGSVLLHRYIPLQTMLRAAGTLVGLLVVSIAVMYVAGYGDLLYERVIAKSTGGDAFQASSGRTFLWGRIFDRMFDQPLTLITGFGLNSYGLASGLHLAPHNSYLKIFFELGAIGLLFMLATFVNAIAAAKRRLASAQPDQYVMIVAGIFGILGLLIAIFFVDIASPWLFFWAYLGVVMRIATVQFSPPESDSSRAGHA